MPQFFISFDEVDQPGVQVAAMAIPAHGNLCGKNSCQNHWVEFLRGDFCIPLPRSQARRVLSGFSCAVTLPIVVPGNCRISRARRVRDRGAIALSFFPDLPPQFLELAESGGNLSGLAQRFALDFLSDPESIAERLAGDHNLFPRLRLSYYVAKSPGDKPLPIRIIKMRLRGYF